MRDAGAGPAVARLWRLSLACSALILQAACSDPAPQADPAPRGAAAVGQPPVEHGEAWTAANESQTEEILSAVTSLLKERSRGEPFIRRDAHPKHHGCAKAIVRIDAGALARELQVGVFAPGARAEHLAWVRFSNGNPDGARRPDIDKDIRGMAVKLMNVEGVASGSQDFVMLTSKEFIARDAEDYLSLHRALTGSRLRLAWHFVTHPRDLVILLRGQGRAGNPLQLEYFSSVPYKLGPRSMKFKARPCASSRIADEVPNDPSPDYLKERLASTLKAGDACYEFFVQPNMDPAANPVENANSAWAEDRSPYIRVATISLPRQEEIDSPRRLNFCENVSFDPWRSHPDTRPLGQINRMRLAIYPAISRLRHDYNQVPIAEPRSHDVCSGDTASLCRAPRH